MCSVWRQGAVRVQNRVLSAGSATEAKALTIPRH